MSPGPSPARVAEGATDEDDARLAAELREHPKEIAEHVMLVDLARNDVGGWCASAPSRSTST